jgi:hypothetical protein
MHEITNKVDVRNILGKQTNEDNTLIIIFILSSSFHRYPNEGFTHV